MEKDLEIVNKSVNNIEIYFDQLVNNHNSASINYVDTSFCNLDSINQAIKQADRYEHSLKREISFLAVHGYLHLKGYNHQKKEDEKIMNDLTEKILNKANIKRSKDE